MSKFSIKERKKRELDIQMYREIACASQSERSFNLLPCPTYQDNTYGTLSLTCHHSIILFFLCHFFFFFVTQNFPFTLLSPLTEIFLFPKTEQHFPSFSCWTNKGWDWLAVLSLLFIWFFFVGYSLWIQLKAKNWKIL